MPWWRFIRYRVPERDSFHRPSGAGVVLRISGAASPQISDMFCLFCQCEEGNAARGLDAAGVPLHTGRRPREGASAMELGKLGVWVGMDGMSAAQAAAFAKRVEEWGYGALWIPE